MLNRLEMLRIFCVAAEASTFKEAAARLSISPQAVTRAVQELEAAVGEPLFHRNTRGIQITEFGEQFAARARTTVGDMDSLFYRATPTDNAEIEGVVRMTAPHSVGRPYLMPLLTRIARDYPALRLELRLSEVLADVIDEKIDVGVRIGFLRDSRFVARRVARFPFFVVGTPALVERVGKPTAVTDLEHLPVTGLIDRNTGRIWPWHFAREQAFTPRAPTFATDDPAAEAAAVLAGLAYGQLPGHLAIPHLRSGQLVSVLDKHAPEPWGIYVYRPQRGPVPARVRLVFDEIVATLGDEAVFLTRVQG